MDMGLVCSTTKKKVYVAVVTFVGLGLFVVCPTVRRTLSNGQRTSLNTGSWHETAVSHPIKCDNSQLGIDDKDVRNIEAFQFSNISLDPRIDGLLDSFDPDVIPKLPLLDNYKNPCWYEVIPENYLYLYRRKGLIFEDGIQKSFKRIIPVYEKRMRELERPWRLRCLPLVYIIGVEKCGTTDLHKSLLKHPAVGAPGHKESSFWGINLWNPNQTFTDYVNVFDEAAEFIRTTSVPRKRGGHIVEYHEGVTIDSSVRTWLSSGGNLSNKKNQNRRGPEYIPAHPIRNLTPESDLKIIVIVRNPIDRLFSSYVYFNTIWPDSISAEDFHNVSANHIAVFKRCMTSHTLSMCLFSEAATPIKKHVKIHMGIYYGYLIHWIKVFPNMKVIRMEDCKRNRTEVINSLVDYIGLEPLNATGTLGPVDNKGPKKPFEMLDKTRDMLEKFYAPFNEMFAHLLNDKRFLFL